MKIFTFTEEVTTILHTTTTDGREMTLVCGEEKMEWEKREGSLREVLLSRAVPVVGSKEGGGQGGQGVGGSKVRGAGQREGSVTR